MLHEILPHTFQNNFEPVVPAAGSILLAYRGREILIGRGTDGTIRYPSFREASAFSPKLEKHCQYLFTLDETACFLVSAAALKPLTESQRYFWEPIFSLRYESPQHLVFVGATGMQLSQWYDNHRFCGHCGSILSHSEQERMLQCSDCGNLEYPQIAPAVIAAIVDGDRILVSRYAGREYKKLALIAGYTEIGESAEETVRREVLEEVGLRVKNIQYYKSQPWPFSGALLLGFFCELDGSGEIVMDRRELSEALWLSREELPDEGPDISLTREMMLAFKYRRRPAPKVTGPDTENI